VLGKALREAKSGGIKPACGEQPIHRKKLATLQLARDALNGLFCRSDGLFCGPGGFLGFLLSFLDRTPSLGTHFGRNADELLFFFSERASGALGSSDDFACGGAESFTDSDEHIFFGGCSHKISIRAICERTNHTLVKGRIT
jgi:hypothetical protein